LTSPTPPPSGIPGGGQQQPGGFQAPPQGQPGGFPPSPPPAGPPPAGSPYGGPGTGQSTNGKAIASLVLGICSIVLCLGFLAGIPAVILGRIAKREIAEGNGTGDGLANAGLITGIIGIVLGVLWLLYVILVIAIGVSSD
jgi:hypothetical protein